MVYQLYEIWDKYGKNNYIKKYFFNVCMIESIRRRKVYNCYLAYYYDDGLCHFKLHATRYVYKTCVKSKSMLLFCERKFDVVDVLVN